MSDGRMPSTLAQDDDGRDDQVPHSDPDSIPVELESLVLERQMPFIMSDCVSRERLDQEVS